MEINFTLFIEIAVFIVLVRLTMRHIWPHIIKAIDERQKKIADGLMAAERGEKSLELARKKATDHIAEAKEKSIEIIQQTEKQAATIISDARKKAEQERSEIILSAKNDIIAETEKAKKQLQSHVVELSLAIVRKLLNKEVVDGDIMEKLVDDFIKGI